MVEGYYCHQHLAVYANDGQTVLRYDEQDAIFNDEPGNRSGSHWTPIAPDTLCQHTGAEDMYFKPIWEHDTVRLHSQYRPARVKRDAYHGQEAEIIYLQGTFSLLLSDGNNMTLKRALGGYDLQVIGNRFGR